MASLGENACPRSRNTSPGTRSLNAGVHVTLQVCRAILALARHERFQGLRLLTVGVLRMRLREALVVVPRIKRAHAT